MSKEIKDYLHLYLGCECHAMGVHEDDYDDPVIPKTMKLTGISYDDTQKQWWGYFENEEVGYMGIEEIFPILRHISDMTEEEAIELQCITTPYRCIDWDKDPAKYDVTFHTDHKLGKDHPNYKQVFSITVVDLRRDFDYMNINLNGDIIRYNHEADKDPVINDRVSKQHEATKFLLSKHFDLFGLIESGLAIDKTKIK